MRKLLIIIILLPILANSQQVVRPASDFYSADSIRNRTDAFRSLMDGVIMWKDSGFVEMDIPLYQPTLRLRFPKINLPKDTVYAPGDTVFIGSDLTPSYKDTIVKGWSKIRLNHLRSIVFTETGTKDSYNLKVLDTTIFRKCPETDFCQRDTMTYKVRKYYEGKYFIKAEEISDFEVEFFFERSQDASGTFTQTYANKKWAYYRREGDTVDELLQQDWLFISDEPGDGLGDTGTEDYPGEELWRHSQTFTKKYYQIKAVELGTGVPKILEIQNNEFK